MGWESCIQGSAHHFKYSARVKILPEYCRKKKGKQHICEFFHSEFLIEGIFAEIGVMFDDKAETIRNMLPGFLHPAFAVLFFFLQKVKGMQREKTGVLFAAVFHALI